MARPLAGPRGPSSQWTLSWRKEDSNSQSHLNKKLSEGARSVPPASGREAGFEALLAFLDGEPAGFALFHRRFSTWLGRPGVYLWEVPLE